MRNTSNISSDTEQKLSYVGGLDDLCNLEIEVKVTQFELGLRLALVLRCTKFGENMSNILQISRGNHLTYARPAVQCDNIIHPVCQTGI